MINLKKLTLFASLLVLSSVTYAGGRASVMLKTGSFTLAEKNQTIVGSVTFDPASTSVIAVEYEYQMKENLSWGGEFIGYNNTYASGTGSARFTHIMFNIRKQFDVAKHVKPFVGIGAGAATVALGGIGAGKGGGFGLQAMAGIKFPFEDLFAVVEYKFISANPEDDAGTSVNSSGTGLFLGLGFSF